MRPSWAIRAVAGPSSATLASSRFISRPASNRYLIIRDFFTRQAIVQPSPPINQLLSRRWSSTLPSDRQIPPSTTPPSSTSPPSSPPGDCPHCHAPPAARRDHAQNYTPFIRRLIQQSSLSVKANYRPSKEELLAAASSWWERLRIRIKWFTIRGWRRFNTDDLSAFASWFVVGNSELASSLV